MISESRFVKETQKETKISADLLRNFFRTAEKMYCLYHWKDPDISQDEKWEKILEFEEKYLWPVYRQLDNPSLSIYQNPDYESECIMFRNSISDEWSLRSRQKNIDPRDFKTGLKELIERRFPLLNLALAITDNDMEIFKKGPKKGINWWFIGATTIATLGVIKGVKVLSDKNKKEEKKG
ncbi:MAG: hypothetical protein A3J63_00400 [Candidatus Moranbacteria bacterium RIFCSPHIGHO2_02_FULL_40_12b]|nr:MAG: hypothetical protein A3J63_00400 [Candidatus Moranbacteria bacterium RIFCSPHIGHO2_02_FULL_40_12b]OGI23018.1 MAG: hypothetical protein A3E91_03380 [Candidatus Moranbacteria bacterium RIFCSPHIGHO2_12_FULL_40_10]